MAAESSNTTTRSYPQEDPLSLVSALHRHAISFQSQSSVTSSSSPHTFFNNNNNNSTSSTSTTNLMFCDNNNNNTSIIPSASHHPTSLLLDTVPGLKHDAGLAVEWIDDEQFKLEQGLLKYKDEPSIMKYIKIAATLRDKTVRDVALRCRWMTRKRRKQEESHLGRKGNYRKDKLGESSSKTALPSASIPTSVGYSFPMNQLDQNQHVKCEVLTGKAKHLLEQNMQAFNQINNNMSLLKLQDNIDLFCRARDNINNVTAILNDMRGFSSKISQMQELPLSIDQNLANSILPHTAPTMMYGTLGGGIQPKQESRC